MPRSPFAFGSSRLSALLEACVVPLALVLASLAASALLGPLEARLANPFPSALLVGVVMVLAVGLVSRRRPTPRLALGLGPAAFWATLQVGLVTFIGCYLANAIATGLYAVVRGGLAQELAQKAGWMKDLGALSLWLVLPLALFVGFWEELAFRGFLLGRLRAAFAAEDATPQARRRADVAAVLVTSLVFALGHGYQGALGLVQTFVVGTVLAAVVLVRGSLWPAIVAHAAIDTFGLVAVRVLRPMLEKAAAGG